MHACMVAPKAELSATPASFAKLPPARTRCEEAETLGSRKDSRIRELETQLAKAQSGD